MRILQLGKFYYPVHGGIEQVMFEITEGLNESKGYRCDVLCANTNLSSQTEQFQNYTVYRAGSFGMLKSTSISPQLIYKLYKIHKEYDIIHVHHPDPMTFLALFFVRPHAKIIVHWHSDIIRQKKALRYFLPLQRWVLNTAQKVITTSDNYAKHSSHLLSFQKKLTTIPIGITPKKREIPNIKEIYRDKKIIFSLGRLVSYKGFNYLVESASYLDDSFIILIAGDGPQKEELNDLIEKKQLSHKVKLLGRITEEHKAYYLDACFTFCLPSVTKAEAFGVVLLEAMQFAKPLITTDMKESGISWVNVDQKTGLHVKQRSAKSLAEAFIKLAKDKEQYAKFCKNAYKRYEKLFTTKSMLDRLKKLYNSLV